MIPTIREQINFDFEILREYYHEPISMPLNHFHNAFEMYYLYEGERYCYVDDKKYLMKRGDLIIINEYTPHRTTASDSFEHILINFKKSFLSELVKTTSNSIYECFTNGIHVLHFEGEERDAVEDIFEKMLDEFHKKAPWHDYYLKTLLVQLLLLTRRYVINMPENNEKNISSIYRIIIEATEYLNNNFSNDITLEFMSNKFFISTYYFSRIFKKFTGVTFIEYLTNVRVKEAMKLLASTNLSINEIATRVGYKNNTHFGRIFKRNINISPRDYRIEYRKHKNL